MRKILLAISILLFFVSFSNNIRCFNKKIKGKWYRNSTIIEQSDAIIDLNIKNELISNDDSFIIFKRLKYFYINNKKKGRYQITNVDIHDSISVAKNYLYLDATQYDIILENNMLLICKYFNKFDNSYRVVIEYYFLKQKE